MGFKAAVNGLLHGISILPSDERADSENCGFTTVCGLRTALLHIPTNPQTLVLLTVNLSPAAPRYIVSNCEVEVPRFSHQVCECGVKHL